MKHITTINTATGFKRVPYVKNWGGALGILQNPITKENPFLYPPVKFAPPVGSKFFRSKMY